MSKNNKQRIADEAKSFVSSIRISPTKLRLFTRMVVGLNIEEAMLQAKFSKKKAAGFVYQAIKSCAANAENNHGLDMDKLYVKEIQVGKSIVMKRFRARAKGRGVRILKPFSNMLVILKQKNN